ncbi:uncharacterized protein N7496_011683 [Penicillium cataractarum]|uniref:NACHT domain-containing protein n=1 Tax=Penicillium cataractarum TaxID=2100454 RepID=A0A9W9RFJ0_9EURO|nr:uncharacterized protein N7496_011683 [Penicillium cataractarum]KAJ5359270.1 hypothetical protein N7496_011683 [Penicillium cataractarum]
MALALATASRLKAEVRLGQAISEFVADLSDEQKARFIAKRSQALASLPSIQDVRSLTAEIDRVSGGRCLGPRLIRVLETVQRFAAIGDIMVGGSQNIIACGVWSLLLTSSSSHLEKLSVLFMNVGRSAPRFEKIAALYSRSPDLQSSVYEYFIVVVHLCHDILRFTKRSTLQKFGAALSDSNLTKYNSEIDSWSKTIQDEVRYLMARRTEEEAEATSRFRNASSIFFRSASAQQKAQARQRILDFCCQFDYMVPWKRARKAGNTNLFRECQHYKSWKSRPDPSTLIYTGKVGAGKSVLLANMVDDLHLHTAGKDLAVAFFFARHDIQETLTARTVIGSLVQQLLDRVTDFTQVAEAFEMTSRKEPLERMLHLLKSVLRPDFKAFVVIDGLDELSNSEGEETLRHLFALRDLMNLSLCLSYRQEPNTSLKLKAGLEPFNAEVFPIPHNSSEIESFITDELGRRVESQKLTINDPLLPLEIRDALVKGSQGMFLWVALQIESLCTMETDEEIRHAINDLPKDLSETFSRILQSSNKSNSPYQKRILELVTVAQRPLTTEELREALSVTPGETNWDSSKLLNNIYHSLKYCGGLVILDEEELTLHLVHHSFKQYLIKMTEGPTDRLVDLDHAHKRMSDIIITYLHTLEITRKALTKEVFPKLDAESTMAGIIRSTRSSMRGSNKLALRLLRSKAPLELNMGKTLAQAWNLRNRPEDHSLFRDYAHTFWHLHIAWSLPLSSQVMPLFQKLCEQNMLSLIIASGDLQALFLKAVSTQSMEFTRYLTEN